MFGLDAPDASVPLMGDAARLEQVLTNLLDNAVKYSPGAGDVTVAIAVSGAEVHLSVRDEGIGLAAGSTERIFAPFDRATNAAERQLPGLGLGLHICRSIVERHGGRIRAESQGEGLGTTIHVWLPRAGLRPPAIAGAGDAADAPADRAPAAT